MGGRATLCALLDTDGYCGVLPEPVDKAYFLGYFIQALLGGGVPFPHSKQHPSPPSSRARDIGEKVCHVYWLEDRKRGPGLYLCTAYKGADLGVFENTEGRVAASIQCGTV